MGIYHKTPAVITTPPAEHEAALHRLCNGKLRPTEDQVANTKRYIQEAQENTNSSRRTKPSHAKSSDASVTFKPSKGQAPTGTTINDQFMSKSERSRRAKSCHGFRKGKQLGKKIWCACINGPGGPRSMCVMLWTEAENRVKHCPHALYQNFRTKEQAYEFINQRCPEAKVTDEASELALHQRTSLHATNLSNPYIYLSDHARNSGQGLMWYEDDDDTLVSCRELATIGHPNYVCEEQRPAALEALLLDLQQEALSATNNQTLSTPTNNHDTTSTITNSHQDSTSSHQDSLDDDDLIHSQVEVLPPSFVTPNQKRKRPNSPSEPPTTIPTSTPIRKPPAAFNPSTDINYIIFTVPPFTLASEFEAILRAWHVKGDDEEKLGKVYLARMRKDDDNCFIAAQIFDSDLGQRIINELENKDYCHIPLAPRWCKASYWAQFFYIYKKQSDHPDLEHLASSTVVQRLKRECPISHHTQLDDLLNTHNDTFAIMESYHSWFGLNAFSPFGNITPSPF